MAKQMKMRKRKRKRIPYFSNSPIIKTLYKRTPILLLNFLVKIPPPNYKLLKRNTLFWKNSITNFMIEDFYNQDKLRHKLKPPIKKKLKKIRKGV